MYFLTLQKKWFQIKKASNDFKIYWNTSLKLLYLQCHKWLLSQNQLLRNDFFGYRLYYWLAKHIKLSKKILKMKRCQCETILLVFNQNIAKFTQTWKQFLIPLSPCMDNFLREQNLAILDCWQKLIHMRYYFPNPIWNHCSRNWILDTGQTSSNKVTQS